jgi:hypothetical protein
MCKIYNEYEICKMQYVKGGSCRTGWVLINVLLIGKPPPPIPDRLSDVVPPSIEKTSCTWKNGELSIKAREGR